MSFILVDRRKAGKGKSTNNRQKLLRRIKHFIKESLPQNIGQGGVSGAQARNTSPVRVTGKALEEPHFVYANGNEHTIIFIGNDQYDRGDEIEFPESDGGEGDGDGGGAGQGEQGEDDFLVHVARDEFLNVFFEDCELPNLTHEKFTDKLENKYQHAGFSTTGNPSQLSVIRSFKQSLPRRWALLAPHEEEKRQLEEELKKIEEQLVTTEDDEALMFRANQIIIRLQELDAKLIGLDSFDKVDLRFRKKEAQPLKTIESVLIMIMDISGSMGQEEKTIARRWFALLYAFIKRRYGTTDLVFIAHTDEAFEMSEDDFFSTRINGGTSVSPALALANKIILERYDPNQTNIYVAHASDGDNWESDNQNVVTQMIGDNGLVKKIQMFSYVEVGTRKAWFASDSSTNLWEGYDFCREQVSDKNSKNNNKMILSVIETADDCYTVFKKIFKKQGH